MLMKIRAGYDIAFTMHQPTAMILMLSVHPSRTKDLLTNPGILTKPHLPLREWSAFGLSAALPHGCRDAIDASLPTCANAARSWAMCAIATRRPLLYPAELRDLRICA